MQYKKVVTNRVFPMKPARIITFRGKQYKLKPSAVLETMPTEEEGIAASVWINRNTYARGYSKAPAQSFPQLPVNA